MKTIALIACVKDKLEQPAPAKEIYTGNQFKSWIEDAEKRNASEIYILSGKYGLLLPEEIIEPYDLNLGNQSLDYQMKWNQSVLKRLNELIDVKSVHVLIYTNRIYYQDLLPEFVSFEIPIEIS